MFVEETGTYSASWTDKDDIDVGEVGSEQFSFESLPARQTEQRKVLLIVPPGSLDNAFSELSEARPELPLLGLAYVAAVLRQQGHDVKVVDCAIEGKSFADLAGEIREFRPVVVGMTCYLNNFMGCMEAAKTAKDVDGEITVVLGGPHVTIFPESAFESPHVDISVLSEGEVSVCNLMNALGDQEKLAQVKGIWFRSDSGEIVRNEPEKLIANLDILPFPALDLFPMEKYRAAVHIRGKKVAHVFSSRGCPFRCTYCNSKMALGRRLRYFSTERVLKEIRQLAEKGYDGIQFYDDTFTLNRTRVEELCNALIASGLKIKWTCLTRADCVDADLIALMKRAGCYLITYGCESADDKLLKLIKKGMTVEQNREALRVTKEQGVLTQACFMLGLPTETPEQSKKTIDFAFACGVDYPLFWIAEPVPGTEMWKQAEEYGSFDTSGRFVNIIVPGCKAVWVPSGRERGELEGLASSAFLRFYLRPKTILRVFLDLFHVPPRRSLRYMWAACCFVWSRTIGGSARRRAAVHN